MILETYTKQPNEIQDYDVDFNEYLASMGGDTITNAAVIVPDGITLVTHLTIDNVVKLFLSGGTDGERYVVTVRATTAGGRVREGEIAIRVKEY